MGFPIWPADPLPTGGRGISRFPCDYRNITITVRELQRPEILEFSASNEVIPPESSCELTWRTSHASRISLTENGVDLDVSQLSTSDSLVVTPNEIPPTC